MIRNSLKKIKNVLYKGTKKVFRKIFSLPIFKIKKNKIVFDNFLGKGYGCNPKYIAEELIKQNVDCDMVWLVKDMSYSIPKQIRKVKFGSIKSYYELATAKIWIDNVRNYKGVKKKKEQFYIQTWHGALGLKKVEADVEEFLSEKYVKEAKLDGKITDLMLTNNQFMENLIRKSFWYSGKILKKGLPRNDILFKPTLELKKKVYDFFNLSLSQNLVIYAPTFRKDSNVEVYQFEYEKTCECLNKKFNGNFVMLIRLHPNVADQASFINYSGKVINATGYPDIQELLAVADVAITDYSSIMFDFSMVNKPVFLLTKDLNDYKKRERNLDFELEQLPFPISKSEEELYKKIESFSEIEYKEACNMFYNMIGLVSNTKASFEVVEIIKSKIE